MRGGERVGGGVLHLGQALCLHWGRGEGAEGGFKLGFQERGRFLSMSPCYIRAAHICTVAHTHTHALTQSGKRPLADSAVPGAPSCSSFICPQRHHRAYRGGVEEAGATQGATIP